MRRRPVVGITTDLSEKSGRLSAVCAMTYVQAVTAAGGLVVVLAPVPELAAEHAAVCDAFVFTGGDDPRTEQWGIPTHPKASPMHPLRQAYETALLETLRSQRGDAPVLGICLGMQLMSLTAGGRMDQHLPETLGDRASLHYDREHEIVPEGATPRALADLVLRGTAHSRHRQAVADAGGLRVLARAPDGIIEAVCDPGRRFYVGVQWHPERTASPALGAGVFERLVSAVEGIGRG